MKTKVALVAIAVVGLALSAGAAQRPAYAQSLVFEVDTAADGVDALPGDGICATATGECTLRAAIMEANAHPGEGHQINVSAPTITLTLAGASEDEAATGDLDIRTIVHIAGAVSPPGVVFVDGAGLDRVFHVLPLGYLELENVGVIGGRVNGGEDGGGILNDRGKLLMNRSLVQGNQVEGAGLGGGIFNWGYLEIYTSSIDGNASFLGGGIYNRGMMTIGQSAITENTVQGEGGGIFNYLGIVDASQVAIESNKAVGDYGGGGIYNKDRLDLADSWVLGNSAGWSGGGIANVGTMGMSRTEVSQNTSLGLGGGIYNGGTLTVVGGSIEGNTAVTGAGIDNYTSGDMSLDGVLISGNVAEIYGGGVDNAGTVGLTGVTLDGNAAMVGAGIANMGADPGTPALATLSSSDIRSNAATDLGGGIVNYQGTLDVTQSSVESNTALIGAGVLNVDGEASLSDCGIRLNQALSPSSDTLGGGVYSSGSGFVSLQRCAISENASDLGGGVFNDSGIVTLDRSVVNGNSAAAGGGIFNYTDFPIGPGAKGSALGAKIRGNQALEALRGASADPPPGTAWTVVSTSTISGNTSGFLSGGVYNASQVEVYNSTISANLSADSEAVYNELGGTVILGNAILVSSGGAVPACAGEGIFESRGFNLENGSSCGLVTMGDLIDTDPLLGPLADNGGPTLTHALLPGSPAIDAGSNILCGAINGALAMDQRGEARPMDGNNDGGAVCDIGAYEAAGPTSSFGDTARDHWAFGYIEWLYEDGYVAGCSAEPRLYCPDQGMLRSEAAVFVVHGVRGAEYRPPEPTSSAFVDVPISEPPVWYAKWVEQLWEDGYTAGCWVDEQGNRWFCPGTVHTRAEAAVFFLHMLLGAQYSPPAATTQVFDDVPIGEGEPWYSRWVYAANDYGILRGCEDVANQGDNLFRPDAALTRAEGGCMMVNALGLNPGGQFPPLPDGW